MSILRATGQDTIQQYHCRRMRSTRVKQVSLIRSVYTLVLASTVHRPQTSRQACVIHNLYMQDIIDEVCGVFSSSCHGRAPRCRLPTLHSRLFLIWSIRCISVERPQRHRTMIERHKTCIHHAHRPKEETTSVQAAGRHAFSSSSTYQLHNQRQGHENNQRTSMHDV